MDDKTKKLMNEMAEDRSPTIFGGDSYEMSMRREEFIAGFTAAHTLAEQEISQLRHEFKMLQSLSLRQAKEIDELKLQLADRTEKYKIAMDKGVDVLSSQVKDLTASFKSAVDALSIIRSNEWIEGECIISGKFYRKTVEQISDETLTQLKSKHPDMFKGETK